MRNLKVVLEYDGTDFCGWQIQPRVRTVQEDLQIALRKIFGKTIHVTGAGRTDSGVHAKGQTANFFVEKEMTPEKIVAALNGNLAKDVRILAAEEVEPDFNSRFAAKKRHYRYSITRIERAIDRHYLWCLKNPLDIGKMKQATEFLIGKQDFKSFCKENADVKHHFCIVEKAEWKQEGNLLTLDIIANRFIHSMVRIIVGTMIDVGRGYTPVEKIPEILAAKDRNLAGQTAPAKGLCLEKIYY